MREEVEESVHKEEIKMMRVTTLCKCSNGKSVERLNWKCETKINSTSINSLDSLSLQPPPPLKASVLPRKDRGRQSQSQRKLKKNVRRTVTDERTIKTTSLIIHVVAPKRSVSPQTRLHSTPINHFKEFVIIYASINLYLLELLILHSFQARSRSATLMDSYHLLIHNSTAPSSTSYRTSARRTLKKQMSRVGITSRTKKEERNINRNNSLRKRSLRRKTIKGYSLNLNDLRPARIHLDLTRLNHQWMSSSSYCKKPSEGGCWLINRS